MLIPFSFYLPKVEVVGYDNEGPVPYFILRNSWGPDYGIDGYLHVAVGNNLCGKTTEKYLTCALFN